MSTINKLAKYIYENQKRGFSDVEIYQLLEQSGWQKADIDIAFQKTGLIKSVDLAFSIPSSFLKNLKNNISPSRIAWLLFSGARKIISGIISIAEKTILLTRDLLTTVFIAYPKSIIKNISASKLRKIKHESSAREISKYIERNLKAGALESDIFIELLRIGWDKKIIDKAFSITNSKILKKNVAGFLKFLILFPFVAVKKTFSFAFFLIKKIVWDAPVFLGRNILMAVSFLLKTITKSTRFAITSSTTSIKRLFRKEPEPLKILARPTTPHLSLTQKIRLYFSGAIQNLRSFSLRLFQKREGGGPPTIVAIQKIPPSQKLWRDLKYFFTSRPRAMKRLRQKLSSSLTQSIKRTPLRIFLGLIAITDYIKYDLRLALKNIFVIFPIRLFKYTYFGLSGLNTKGIILLPAKLTVIFLGLLRAIFSHIPKLFKKIDIKTIVWPFEITELIIAKLVDAIKKLLKLLFAPIYPKLKETFLSLKRIFFPISKELEFTPQTLSEIPIGKVPDTMRAADVLRIAARMFKTRRMRTFLTILGIGIGIGAILFLVSLGYGLQRILIEEIATSDALLSLDVTTRDEVLIPLDKSSLEKFTSLSEVSYISPLIAMPGQISIGNTTAQTMINGILPNYFKLGGIVTTNGELFKEGDDNKILITPSIIKLLSPGEFMGDELSPEQLNQMIGKEVSITLLVPIQSTDGVEEVKTVDFHSNFIIGGVVEDSMGSLVYFPLSRIEEVGITKYQSAKVRVIDTESLEPVRTKAVELGFIVAALSDTIEQANKVFQVLQIILALFGIVALAVSAIGMFNTMTIALLERTQEIGIMKSLGASNKNVWELFLAESIIMGFLGGAGGIAIGYIGSESFNLVIRILAGALGGRKVQLFERPWWFIVTILVFSTVVGLFTGLWPAKRAAKINILQALRYK